MQQRHSYKEEYTVDDYENWSGDWELVDGRPMAMTPSPGPLHQIVSLKIARHLDEQLDDCPQCHVLMETDLYLSGATVVRPDVMVLCAEIGHRVVCAPDIVFEVVSKDSLKRDEILKAHLYAEEGVLYYGIVYPEQKKVKLYKLMDGAYRKMGDFFQETWCFDGLDCKLEINCSKIWKGVSF